MNIQKVDLVSNAFMKNPIAAFARMRESGPVVRAKMPIMGEIWLATSYETVNEILKNQDTFVRNARNAGAKGIAAIPWWLPPMFRAMAKNMLSYDEPDHRRLRSLVEQAFQRRSVEGMRDRIEVLADAQLDEMEAEAKKNGGRVDFLPLFARPFPLAVICELLGLPAEDRPKFMRWAGRFSTIRSLWGIFSLLPGMWKMHHYIRHQFRLCREQPRPGLMSELAAVEQQGDRLSEDELVAMGFLLLFAGHETTVHLLTGGILALLQHPEQKAQLLADWSLVEPAVEELLRYVSPVQMTKPRFANKDLEFHGQQIKRGDLVVALIAAANGDSAHFPDPEKFDIRRQPNHHLAFGTGIHVCLGLKLARLEAQIALKRIFTRFPDLHLAVSPDELQWNQRPGLRALSSLPVRLSAN